MRDSRGLDTPGTPLRGGRGGNPAFDCVEEGDIFLKRLRWPRFRQYVA